MAEITVPGGATASHLGGYLAVPRGPGPWPGVVVIHEIIGLNEDIRRQADRLAQAGFVAVAPDLYTAGGALRCLRATIRAVFAGHGPAFDDIEAVRGWLAAREDCTGRVGVLGFCIGGQFALLAATKGFDAAAVNYGPLPKKPVEALVGACPIVASYGSRDLATRNATAKLDDALTMLAVEHDVREYKGAGHSFASQPDSRALSVLETVLGMGYQAEATGDMWRRTLAFFEAHLADPDR
ncbi:MAG: carboxymethylenebutenolidase [Frankiales bacterium]|jgi:carboxymethylenebutenolidase|nr:carboxymethylenebutenolidase [Frankiales bacterium]